FAATFCAAAYWVTAYGSPFASPGPLDHYLNGYVSERGNRLYFDFLAGSLIYVYRYQIPHSGSLALAFAALIVLNGLDVLPLGEAHALLLAIPVAYVTAFIGLLRIPKLPLYSRGDYSYGIYLYGYPLQQLLVLAFPGRFSVVPHFICSTLLVT